MKQKKYPNWVCSDCELKASGGRSFTVSCYHKGKCDVCGKVKQVTEPRDFYYSDFEEK